MKESSSNNSTRALTTPEARRQICRDNKSWPERRVVRVDQSPMNPKIKVAQLSCGHDVYRQRAPRIGATIVCDKCAEARR